MSSVSDEERVKFTSLFQKVVADSGDSDGLLSLDGFRKLMPMCGHSLPLAETAFLFTDADSNSDWKISLDEFLGILSKPDPFLSVSKIAKIRSQFEEHDLNKDGYLSLDEVRTLLCDVDDALDEAWIQSFMKEWDKNGDDRINFEEFVNMYINMDEEEEHEEAVSEDMQVRKKDKLKDILVTADEIRRISYERDIVKFGRVSIDDLKSVLSGVKMQLADEPFEACISLLDQENYGSVNFEEFVSVFEDISVDKFYENETVIKDGPGKESTHDTKTMKEERGGDENDKKQELDKSLMNSEEEGCQKVNIDLSKLSATFEDKQITEVPKSQCRDDGAGLECKDVGVKAMIARLEETGK